MRLLNSRFAIPVGSFLAAVALSFLGGGPIRLAHGRRAADPTACTGSVTGVSITVAAGTGLKNGSPGWTFAITDQPVDLVNSQTAGLVVTDTLMIDMDNVVGIDTAGKTHPFGTQTLTVDYLPVLVLDKSGLPPQGSHHNAIPATITLDGIKANLFKTVSKLLPGVTFTQVTGTLKAQTTVTHQLLAAFCNDGTELTPNPRPDTKLHVNGNGNGKAVKN